MRQLADGIWRPHPNRIPPDTVIIAGPPPCALAPVLPVTIGIKADPGVKMPKYGHEGDAGFDLVVTGGNVDLAPGTSADLPTGLRMQMAPGIHGRITGRSSTYGRGLLVIEGIIDQGYRGYIFVRVKNDSKQRVRIEKGDRLAQMIIAPVIRASFVEVDELETSDRGSNGFGSTGKGEWTR
jgi:dUTP pyrophosphatase